MQRITPCIHRGCLTAMTLSLWMISLPSFAQNFEVSVYFSDKNNVLLSNNAGHTLKVYTDFQGVSNSSFYMGINERKYVSGHFSAKRVKRSQLRYEYDQYCLENDIRLVNSNERQLRANKISGFNIVTTLASLFSENEIMDKIIKIISAEIGTITSIELAALEEEVRQRTKGAGILERKMIRISIFSSYFQEKVNNMEFPSFERQREEMRAFYNRNRSNQSSANLWRLATNTGIFLPKTPYLIAEGYFVGIGAKPDNPYTDQDQTPHNQRYNQLLGRGLSDEYGTNWGVGLSMGITPSHFVGKRSTARLYVVGRYEDNGFRIISDGLMDIQRRTDPTAFVSMYRFNGNTVVKQQTGSLGLRYMVLSANAKWRYSLEGGLIKTLGYQYQLKPKDGTDIVQLPTNQKVSTINIEGVKLLKKPSDNGSYAGFSLGYNLTRNRKRVWGIDIASRWNFSPLTWSDSHRLAGYTKINGKETFTPMQPTPGRFVTFTIGTTIGF